MVFHETDGGVAEEVVADCEGTFLGIQHERHEFLSAALCQDVTVGAEVEDG